MNNKGGEKRKKNVILGNTLHLPGHPSPPLSLLTPAHTCSHLLTPAQPSSLCRRILTEAGFSLSVWSSAHVSPRSEHLPSRLHSPGDPSIANRARLPADTLQILAKGFLNGLATNCKRWGFLLIPVLHMNGWCLGSFHGFRSYTVRRGQSRRSNEAGDTPKALTPRCAPFRGTIKAQPPADLAGTEPTSWAPVFYFGQENLHWQVAGGGVREEDLMGEGLSLC